MTADDTRRQRLLETVPYVKGDAADVLPEDLFRRICRRWIPEMDDVDTAGRLFIEHGYESGYIADFLSNELIWATENSGCGVSVPQQRKWNLLYTIECLSLCHVSNVLTWAASENGVTPQVETTPWRRGPERNWYDCDIEPVDSCNLNEKLDSFKIPRYPRYTDEPSRYYNAQDTAVIGLAMADSLGRSSGLTERLSMLNDQLPVRPFNDRGVGKWGGIPTFATPFESDAPSVSDSPLISKVEYSPECMRTAIMAFLSKKKEIEEMYGFIMDSMSKFADEQMNPPEMPESSGKECTADEYARRLGMLIDFRKAEKCRRFASFYRFADMDLWKNFDYIMKTYRVQDESQYNLQTGSTGRKGSFCELGVNEAQPKLGTAGLHINRALASAPPGDHGDQDAVIYEDTVPETIINNENDRNYDFTAAPAIWKIFGNQKRLVVRDLAVKTLADVKRQAEDMSAELEAAQECADKGDFSHGFFERSRIEAGIRLNSRIPTQRFMKPEVLIPLNPRDIKITFNKNAMKSAAGRMISDGMERASCMIKSDFSMKEQEDHLRGAALSLHAMVCMAVDAAEGRGILEDWAADVYSSIQEHSMNDALLPRDRSSKAFAELARDPLKMKNHRFVSFSRIREGTKAARYGQKPAKDGITTFGEWNQIEQMVPSPNFRPYVERADGLSFRELIKHGLSGTPLQNGLTRDNARYVMAPRITKWRLRSSLKDAAETVRRETAAGGSEAFLSHIGNKDRLAEARKGILEFILDFCDEFAKNAHKTRMDIFNDPETDMMLGRTDDLAVRRKLLKTAEGSWMLGSSGLYVRNTGLVRDDSFFTDAENFAAGSFGPDGAFKKAEAGYTLSGSGTYEYRRLLLLSLVSYARDITDTPASVRLGLMPADQYMRGRFAAVRYMLKENTDVFYGNADANDWEWLMSNTGNMLREDSQYMPLLRGLAAARNPFTGNWHYDLRADQKDINRIFMYMDLFSPLTKSFSTPEGPGFFASLPMGMDKTGYMSVGRLYETAVDNMMRIAWNGSRGLMAARSFRDVASRQVTGYMDSLTDSGAGKIRTKCGAGTVKDRLTGKRIPAKFIRVPSRSEEDLEYSGAYTLAPWTGQLYREKNTILKYSPLNPDYFFITSYTPFRRNSNGILALQHGADSAPWHFGLPSYGYGRGMDGIRKNEISEEYRLTWKGQEISGMAYAGENPVLPSALLRGEALRVIRSDAGLSGKFDDLKAAAGKECVIARSGNSREDRSPESARMRCLMQDIGHTVRKIREKNPELPETVMSAAAMDPLARMGEPEVTESRREESVREAELQSVLRKAYWGEDFCSIRRHLAAANHKFFEQQTVPGGCGGRLSARYAYQYAFLRNMDFLRMRYEAGSALMRQPRLPDGRPDLLDYIDPYDAHGQMPGRSYTQAVSDRQWQYLNAMQQNCASVSVKAILRDYFSHMEESRFDDTNLLRTMPFRAGRTLDTDSRREAALMYPGSPEYPGYERGMEFYRSNIPYGEFMGWAYDAFSPDRYNMIWHIEKFFARAGKENPGLNKNAYGETLHRSYAIASPGAGIRGLDRTIYGTESFSRPDDRILLKLPDEKGIVYSVGDFAKIRDTAFDKLRESYYSAARARYEHAIDCLAPMEGAVTRENVPFLWDAMQSDFIKSLFISDIERKEHRRDYYPSADEMSVLRAAFRAGLAAYCRQTGIAAETGKDGAEPVTAVTDTPPDWMEI